MGGKWWNNPDMVKRLGITAEQQKKMDDVLQQSRLKLIDLSAALEKEEVVMEGLMRGPQLDDAKILPAIDRIAQARAELEKANARLMLGLRHVLTPEQWEKLEKGRGPSWARGRMDLLPPGLLLGTRTGRVTDVGYNPLPADLGRSSRTAGKARSRQ